MINYKLFQTDNDRYTKSVESYCPFVAKLAELIVQLAESCLCVCVCVC